MVDSEDLSSLDEYDLESNDSSSEVGEQNEINDNNVDFPTNDQVLIQNIVIDPGSAIFKAGFAGEEFPSVCLPSIVGTPKIFNEKDWLEMREKIRQRSKDPNSDPISDLKVGIEAVTDMLDLQLFYPIKRGRIEHFNEFEALIELAFINNLDVTPENTNVLIAEPPMHSHHSREKIGEIMFELLSVNGMKTMNESILSLYSSGRTTGLMVSSGDQISHVTPIYDGYIIDHAIQRINLGGRDVTHYLQRIMLERGYDFNSSAEHLIAGKIKEALCFVSPQFDDDIEIKESEFEETFELPDGSDITLGNERFRAPEILFDPMILGKEMNGITEMAYKSFSACPIDVKESLRKNVILSGGTTLFDGFGSRLADGLRKIDSQYRPFKVIETETRQFSPWMGGSVFASLSTFYEQVITREDYEEEGTRILHKSQFV